MDGCTQCNCYREQQADPVCRATLVYLDGDRPVPFLRDVMADVADSFGVRIARTMYEVLDLASEAALIDVLHDGVTVPLLLQWNLEYLERDTSRVPMS